MKQPDLSAYPYLQRSKKAKPQLHIAQLLMPDEVEIAFKDDPEDNRSQVRGHWLLTGAVNQEMYAALLDDVGRETTSSLATLTTPAGAKYAILCVQLHSRQHRYVLPLYEPKVVQFITSAAREPFQMYIESSGEDETRMLYTCPLAAERFLSVRSNCMTIDLARRHDFLRELPALIEHVTSMTTMKVLSSPSLTEVDVSILLPHQSDAGGPPKAAGYHTPDSYRH